MRAYLLNLKLKGMKNIYKEIKLSFYKPDLKNFNSGKYRVKGIFGRNGIGKTALVKSVEIVKNIVVEENYLKNRKNQAVLGRLINKNTGIFHIGMEFLLLKGNKRILSHFLELEKKRGKVVVRSEKIGLQNIKGEIIDEIEILKGKVIKVKKGGFSIEAEKMEHICSELTEEKSILNFFKEDRNSGGKENDLISLYHIYDFLIKVYTQDSDKSVLKVCKDIKTVEEVKRRVRKKAEFLKLFISDLKNVRIEEKKIEKGYFLEFILEYRDYSLNIDFESMGIRNLFLLYDYFIDVYEGKIVFADEIDLSIHEIYLNKIVEFLARMGEGQLIFTCHNTGLLDILKKFRYSIDFLTENQEIESWKQKGNSSPRLKYREGMLKDMPFNIEYYDFYPLFTGDDE